MHLKPNRYFIILKHIYIYINTFELYTNSDGLRPKSNGLQPKYRTIHTSSLWLHLLPLTWALGFHLEEPSVLSEVSVPKGRNWYPRVGNLTSGTYMGPMGWSIGQLAVFYNKSPSADLTPLRTGLWFQGIALQAWSRQNEQTPPPHTTDGGTERSCSRKSVEKESPVRGRSHWSSQHQFDCLCKTVKPTVQ